MNMYTVTVSNGKTTELSLRILTSEEVDWLGRERFQFSLENEEYAVTTFLEKKQIVEFSLEGSSYDFALPNDFFQDYLERHGEAPSGVWLYPPSNPVFGGYYRFSWCLDRLWNNIYQAIRDAQWKELPGREKENEQ
jgi:hypothetical protein